MIDFKNIATSMADGLNGIARAMRTLPMPKSTPEMERWNREMNEASRHVLMAFGIDPEQLKNPFIPVGGSWVVEWSGGDDGEWKAVERK
ncbi:MAG: hypothetical protein JO199_07745 [Candidatus Eremiobacteraeota bacterium]|nr:hypothetical protein [Candidatus Eremiobacteraeota bacterium]